MKFRITYLFVIILTSAFSLHTYGQSVFPAKQTIDKKEFLGLALSNSVPEKYLSNYWETYLDKFGKVKGKRGVYTIEKAGMLSVSPNPVQLTSQVNSEQKNQSKVFMALYVDGSYVGNYSDQTYKAAESILKDFSGYASVREEARQADEAFTAAEKSYQKQQKDIEEKTKDIEKGEKKLAELRAEVEKGKTDSAQSLLDLQNKQKALETIKAKIPSLK